MFQGSSRVIAKGFSQAGLEFEEKNAQLLTATQSVLGAEDGETSEQGSLVRSEALPSLMHGCANWWKTGGKFE